MFTVLLLYASPPGQWADGAEQDTQPLTSESLPSRKRKADNKQGITNTMSISNKGICTPVFPQSITLEGQV